MSKVHPDVEKELRTSFVAAGFGAANLSVVDDQAHACIRRVLGRRGVTAYRYAYVWPVVSVTVMPGTSDSKTYIYDVRELGEK